MEHFSENRLQEKLPRRLSTGSEYAAAIHRRKFKQFKLFIPSNFIDMIYKCSFTAFSL